MSVWAIVVAAGAGDRFGGMKQFAILGRRRVVDWSVAAARSVAHGVVVVVPPGWEGDGFEADAVVAGAATRSGSVRAGLGAVPPDAEVIVVHDAARPLASARLFGEVVAAVAGEGVDGAVPGVSLVDTVKRVRDGAVVATVDRTELVAVQTPQAFRAAALRRAHGERAEGTDDASLVERCGGRVVVVGGEPTNAKLTGPDDLVRAEEAVQRLLDGS